MNARRLIGIGENELDRETRLKRLRFRSWHRGTKEADLMVGGFYDRYSHEWGEDEIAWYELLMDEEDVDIMAWAIGTATPPAHVAGPMMTAMQRLDYIPTPE
jgi:antitoxin CptB